MSDYLQNPERFAAFHRLQSALAAALARQPAAVRAWLDHQRAPARASRRVPDSNGWRTSRLTGRRQQALRGLLDEGRDTAAWLLGALPVGSLLEIGERAGADPEIASLSARVLVDRETLFHANIGLAKHAAGPGRRDEFGDRLTAACCGLLDAIDRYVPGAGAARFSYFAMYWVRYHISRFSQKHGSLVSFPIHQQRLQQANGRPQYDRPAILSIHAPNGVAEVPPAELVMMLQEDAPKPGASLDGGEVTGRIESWLRRTVPASTRVMLAVLHAVGPLADAASDYLALLREIARERLRFLPSQEECPRCRSTMTSLPPANGLLRSCMSLPY